MTFIIYLLAGSSIGAALGYFGKCSSGTCPLTANWRRGTLYGAVLATLFYLTFGRAADAPELNQSTANVKHITDTEFDAEVTRAPLPVVADFYATWCGPCRQLAPVVDELAGRYAGKIKFVKINVDESPELARRFQVSGIPMLGFFKNGKLTDTSVGLVSREELATKLEALTPTHTRP